jgi:hypothetical protein
VPFTPRRDTVLVDDGIIAKVLLPECFVPRNSVKVGSRNVGMKANCPLYRILYP